MTYSNEELIKRIEKAKKKQKALTHITDKSKLSTEEKLKLSLCKHFVQFANSKRMKLKEMSAITKIPVTRLSEITNYKIKKFTVDQLLKNLSILAKKDTALKAYLTFLEEAAELPTLKTSETQRLTKRMKKLAGNCSPIGYL